MLWDELYAYGMRLRGFSPGAQPMEGLVCHSEQDLHAKYYSVLYYDRRLTPEELKAYDLDSLTPKTKAEELAELGHESYKHRVQRALDVTLDLAYGSDYFGVGDYEDDQESLEIVESIVKKYIENIKEEEHN